MKTFSSFLFLLLFISGVNAQIGSPFQGNPVKLSKNFTKAQGVQNQLDTGKGLTNSLISNQFISKAGGYCVDTLSYPFQKQSQVDPQELYLYTIDDDVSNGLNETVMAQVFKTGNVSLQISGVELFISKLGIDFLNTVNAEISIYTLSGGIPTTKIGSIIYTIPDTITSVKYVNFSSPISVSSDFAVAVTLKTPNKSFNIVITDPVFSSTYDEQLSFYGVLGYQMMTVNDLYLAQPTPINYDYDLILHPIISYTNDMTLAASPNPVCQGGTVTFTGTVTPTGIENRFLNWQTFLDYFNFYAGATPYTSVPLGLVDQSIILFGNNVTHTYTTPGTYDAYMEYESGFGTSCYANNTASVTVNAPVSATFSYSGSNFCQSSAAATPTITNIGGTFSVTPSSGLSINTSTGEINFAASTPGSYLVKYVVTNGACSDSNTATINVSTPLSAAFSYASNSVCSNATNPQITLNSGATAGTFSATPVGLSINASTGEINLATSSVGNYTVTNTVSAAGACAGDSKTFAITIVASPDATFAYSGSNFCQSSPAATPSITTTGGVFSVTPSTGLAFNATTGLINFASSAVGSYVIQYDVNNGACSDTKATTINVVSSIDASFSYGSNSFCSNGSSNTQVTLNSGSVSGTFSASPAGLSINTTTGQITTSTSNVGSYTVTNTVSASGGCPGDSKSFNVSIVASPDATFTYSGSHFCQSSTAVTPSITTTGGTFSVTPSTGLSINTSTGMIDFTSSTIGSYIVQYVVLNGTCSDTKTTIVNVVNSLNATFSYAVNSFCSNDTSTCQVTLSAGASAGTFSATPAGLSIDGTTGEVYIAASSVGTYTVTNAVSASGGCLGDSKTYTVEIKTLPDATITPVSSLCENDNLVTLSATTAGGTFSGNDVANGLFNPATAGNGMHVVEYEVTENGCTASDTTVIQVDALPSVVFTTPSTTCDNGVPVSLTATPSGGTFTGTGVVGTTFNPAAAGVGSHDVVYTVTVGACTTSKTNSIAVDSCLSVINADMIQVELFPIPAENELTIKVNTDVTAQVVSIDGKLLMAPFKVANQVNYTLNTQSFARGMYLLKLTTDNGFEKVQRIILK